MSNESMPQQNAYEELLNNFDEHSAAERQARQDRNAELFNKAVKVGLITAIGAGAVSGAMAFSAHNEAIKYEGVSFASEQYGDVDRAIQAQEYSQDRIDARNQMLGHTALLIGGGGLSLSFLSQRKKEVIVSGEKPTERSGE